MYDFDSVFDRRETFSLKWDIAENELPMWVADMDFKTAPKITDALIKRASHGIFGYSVVPDRWYAAYTNWWRSRHGAEFTAEELIFSTGVIPIISSCVRKLTTAAENVVVLTPVYNIFFNSIRNNGRNIIECPLQYDGAGYDIDFKALETALSDPQTTMLLFCNPHNPVGKVWSRETLKRIGDLAYKHGVTVISDEIHCDLTDPGCNYVPFASVSDICKRISVTCISPTKAFNLAGLQTAAAVVHDKLLRHKVWRALNTDEVAEPNAFAIQAAVTAFNECQDWLDELREYIYRNKKLVRSFLESEIPKIKLTDSQATYLLWLDCAAFTDDSKTLAGLIRNETGLYLSDGTQYGKGGERFLRMNIACPKSVVLRGLERLKKAMEVLNLHE